MNTMGIPALLLVLLSALFQFLIIYLAIRLALKHDRQRSGGDWPRR